MLPELTDTFAVSVVLACCVPVGVSVTDIPLGAVPVGVFCIEFDEAVPLPPLFDAVTIQ